MQNSSKCANTASLYKLAEERDYDVTSFRLKYHPSLEIFDGHQCHIALDPTLSGWAEKNALAHAIGHCETNAFYSEHSHRTTILQAEGRARRWTYEKLLPTGLLHDLFKNGVTETWEIAEATDCDETFVKEAIRFYSDAGLLCFPDLEVE